MPYFSDWWKFKSPFFSGWPCITLQASFQGIYAEAMSPKSSVSNILELLLTWLTSNPHFKTKCTAVSAMSSFCSHLPNMYEKRINPKFATESECNHIYVSFSMRMLLSDIWSRSNFWVTVHAFWVLMSVKQLIHSPIYRLNQSLLLQMLASFARSVWVILMIFMAQNGTWNVPGISDCLLGYTQKYMGKNHFLLRISAVISRYGPHLMIVMIFVTPDNF